jgi:tetratricopeptide (TPR) repeat protein
MNSSHISEQVKEIIQTAKESETIGKYEEAIDILSPYWTNPKEFPNTSELNKEEQAEILLRCGSVTSNLGSCKQTNKSQEHAQNMLRKAHGLFMEIGIDEKISDCEAHLATTFYRMGSLEEANVWIKAAFQHNLEQDSEISLYAHIVEGMILFDEKKYVELVNKCKKIEKLFQSSLFYVLQGDFNNNYAFSLMRLGDKENAIKRFNLAKSFYKQTKHYLYLAALENNLAIFYETEERYKEAHKSVISAIENYKKAGDKSHEGYSIDTRSHIFMSEGKYVEALACASEAIKILSSGENYCYLANSMQTKSHIEFYLKNYEASIETMIASVNIASIHISQSQAKKFIDAYAELLKTLEK